MANKLAPPENKISGYHWLVNLVWGGTEPHYWDKYSGWEAIQNNEYNDTTELLENEWYYVGQCLELFGPWPRKKINVKRTA